MAWRGGEEPGRGERVITARDIVRVLRRGALLALLAGLVAGAAAYYASSVATPIYSGEVGVIASQPGAQYGELNIITPPTVDPGVYQSAILEGNVAVEALTRLQGSSPSESELEEFLESVDVRVEDAQRSSTIWIEVRHPSPAYAADAANFIAEELVVWDRQRARRSLDRSIAAIEDSIADLEARLEQAIAAGEAERAEALRSVLEGRELELASALEVSSAVVVGLLEPLRSETPPERPVGPRTVFTTVLAALLGIVLAYGLQILLWTLDVRVGGRDEVMAATDLPVLAEFPMRRRRSLRLSAEAAGFFHANVVSASRGASPRILVVTSPTKPAEKTGVAMSLAENFARSGQKTLLVDADLRHAGVTDWLDLVPSSAPSFDAYLADVERPFLPVSVAVGGKQSFDFVPSFTSARFPVDLLNEGFGTRLDAWRETYDVIVLDSAPVVPFADALAIAPSCTGLILCTSATRSTRDDLEDAIDLLAGPHITVLGIVLTDVGGRRGRSTGSDAPQASQVSGESAYKTRVPTTHSRTRQPMRRG